MKKLLPILFFLTLIFCITTKVMALVEPTSEFYVNDYANVLSEETENYIMSNSVKLASATNAQIVVVTVKSLEGQDIEKYATALFRKFGIGGENENNGLLILLAPHERDVRIEVGYGLEGIITDGLAGRYLDNYFVPYFQEDNWDEGIKNGYSALYKKICDYYEIDTSNIKIENIAAQNMTEIKKRESLKMMLYAVGLISGLIFGFFIKKDNATVRLVFVILCIFAILSNIYLINALSHLSIVYDLNSEITESLIAEIILAIVGALLSAFIINPRHNGKKGGFGGGYYDRGGDYGGYSSGGYSSGGFSGGGFSGGGGSSGGGGASRHF